jgi:uncharacterized phiE125 gp8 family phage protein
MIKTIIITAPLSEPVTLTEVKEQLRIEDSFTLDDDYLNSLISTARDRCENYCNQFFTVQDIALVTVAESEVCLPYPNLTITSVEIEDVATLEYSYDPDTQILTLTGSFNAGDKLKVYATTGAPVQIVGVEHSIKMIVDDMYELRSESVLGVSVAENPALKALLYPYRLSLGI